MATDQEIFDKTARHLAAQGFMAYNECMDICKYRTKEGYKCAVGCHIPDDLYNIKMEKYDSCTILDIYPNLSFLVPNTELLKSLQLIHDYDYNWYPDRMVIRLLETANDYGLDASILDKLDFGLIIPHPLQ